MGLVLGGVGSGWWGHRPGAWQGLSWWGWGTELPRPRYLVARPGPQFPHVPISGRRKEGQKAGVESSDMLGGVPAAPRVGTVYLALPLLGPG